MIRVNIQMRAAAPETFAAASEQQRIIDAIEALVRPRLKWFAETTRSTPHAQRQFHPSVLLLFVFPGDFDSTVQRWNTWPLRSTHGFIPEGLPLTPFGHLFRGIC